MATAPTDRTPKRKRTIDVDFTIEPGTFLSTLHDWRKDNFQSSENAMVWLLDHATKLFCGDNERAWKYVMAHCAWTSDWRVWENQKKSELGCNELSYEPDIYTLKMKVERAGEDGIATQLLGDIEPTKVSWVWFPYIPAGAMSVVAGDPGMGKSQLAVDILSRISRGGKMPDDSDTRISGACGIATAEDSTANTVIPRIMAAGGDRKFLHVIRKVRIKGEEHYFSLPRDLAHLKHFIKTYRLKVLVVDPFSAFLDLGIDSHSDHNVRVVLGKLQDLAEETGCAIIVIAHLNKKEDAATLYRVCGSIAFIAASRSVLAVFAKEDGTQILYSLKSNLAKKPAAMKYQIEGASVKDSKGNKIPTSHIVWLGLSDFDPSKPKSGEGPQMMKECRDFFKEMFRESSQIPATDMQENAKAVGIPFRTLCGYKRTFHVGAKKVKDKWYWVEPEGGIQ